MEEKEDIEAWFVALEACLAYDGSKLRRFFFTWKHVPIVLEACARRIIVLVLMETRSYFVRSNSLVYPNKSI